jgi:hypothetical protein
MIEFRIKKNKLQDRTLKLADGEDARGFDFRRISKSSIVSMNTIYQMMSEKEELNRTCNNKHNKKK